jgi:two-component sensor histidine kinase
MLNSVSLDYSALMSDAARESNHRIANNLALIASLVRMKASAIRKRESDLTPQEAADQLKEIALRIDGVAKLHRLLSSQDASAPITAGPHLADICAGVSLALATDHDVAFHDESDAFALPAERLNALGLFLTEGLTNAIKYAHPAGAPGKVVVRFSAHNGGAHLAIQDDGVGLPEGFDPAKNGGLGMRIMRSLSEQLDAAMSMDASDLGLQVGLNLKAPIDRPGEIPGF